MKVLLFIKVIFVIAVLVSSFGQSCIALENEVVDLHTSFAPYRSRAKCYTPLGQGLSGYDVALVDSPEIKVPVGVSNLCVNAEVSSDSKPIIGALHCAVDGSKKAESGHVEFGSGIHWIQIDFGTNSEIFVIWIWRHYYGAHDWVCSNVVVQVSNDKEFGKDVSTVFNNDSDDSIGRGIGTDNFYVASYIGKPIILSPVIYGRYVRIYGEGGIRSNSNNFREIEIYGKGVRLK